MSAINKVCRLCLSSLEANCINCLEHELVNANLFYLFGFKVKNTDKVSRHICITCCSKIIEFTTYKQLVLKNQNEILVGLINSTNAGSCRPVHLRRKSCVSSFVPDSVDFESITDDSGEESDYIPNKNVKTKKIKRGRKRKNVSVTNDSEPKPIKLSNCSTDTYQNNKIDMLSIDANEKVIEKLKNIQLYIHLTPVQINKPKYSNKEKCADDNSVLTCYERLVVSSESEDDFNNCAKKSHSLKTLITKINGYSLKKIRISNQIPESQNPMIKQTIHLMKTLAMEAAFVAGSSNSQANVKQFPNISNNIITHYTNKNLTSNERNRRKSFSNTSKNIAQQFSMPQNSLRINSNASEIIQGLSPAFTMNQNSGIISTFNNNQGKVLLFDHISPCSYGSQTATTHPDFSKCGSSVETTSLPFQNASNSMGNVIDLSRDYEELTSFKSSQTAPNNTEIQQTTTELPTTSFQKTTLKILSPMELNTKILTETNKQKIFSISLVVHNKTAMIKLRENDSKLLLKDPHTLNQSELNSIRNSFATVHWPKFVNVINSNDIDNFTFVLLNKIFKDDWPAELKLR